MQYERPQQQRRASLSRSPLSPLLWCVCSDGCHAAVAAMMDDGALSSNDNSEIVCISLYHLQVRTASPRSTGIEMSHGSETPHDFETIATKKGTRTPYEFYFSNEQKVREAQIAQANMQLLREELGECVRTEGLNANVNCYELRKKMFDLLTKDRFRGMIFPEGEEPSNRAVGHIAYMPNGLPK